MSVVTSQSSELTKPAPQPNTPAKPVPTPKPNEQASLSPAIKPAPQASVGSIHKTGGMDLAKVHPITAVHELCRRLGHGPPQWHERVAGGWACDVTVGTVRYDMVGSRNKKQEAQRECAARGV